MTIAKILVSGVQASAVEYAPKIPMGIVGATVTFEFTDLRWEGLSKTAVFQGCVTRDVIITGDVITVPAETVEQKGPRLMIGVYGVDADNNMVIPTLWASAGRICDAADPSGDPGTDPGLPIWAQLQAEIDKLKGTGATDEQIAQAVAKYLEDNPVSEENVDETLTQSGVAADAKAVGDALAKKLSSDDLASAIDTALAQAKESGAFDGADGQDGKDGADGSPGEDGQDGVSCTHSWSGTTLTVTSASGTSFADLKGEQGEPGEDGYTPVKGTDYYTEADKTEMVNAVIAALPTWTGGSY